MIIKHCCSTKLKRSSKQDEIACPAAMCYNRGNGKEKMTFCLKRRGEKKNENGEIEVKQDSEKTGCCEQTERSPKGASDVCRWHDERKEENGAGEKWELENRCCCSRRQVK